MIWKTNCIIFFSNLQNTINNRRVYNNPPNKNSYRIGSLKNIRNNTIQITGNKNNLKLKNKDL
jgi:hypothetical protein